MASNHYQLDFSFFARRFLTFKNLYIFAIHHLLLGSSFSHPLSINSFNFLLPPTFIVLFIHFQNILAIILACSQFILSTEQILPLSRGEEGGVINSKSTVVSTTVCQLFLLGSFGFGFGLARFSFG